MTYRLIEGMVHRKHKGEWEPLDKEEANQLLARFDDETDENDSKPDDKPQDSARVH